MQKQTAIKNWQDLLGHEYVLTDEYTLSSVATATFSTSSRVVSVIFPGNLTEVQECLRIANRFQLPIYAVSTGKNWGYGSRVPVTTNNVVMSLTRMNRILDYNEKLAYVTVEPGVTFQQVYDFLKAQNSRLLVNSPGSTADASMIGNALERGIVQGVSGERSNDICGLEVVLPTGNCIRTGYGCFPNSQTTALYSPGIGPFLDGLFTQSNLGVVTQMTMWLSPLPNYTQTFDFRIQKNVDLITVIDRLQTLKIHKVIDSSCGFFNDYRIMSLIQQYPWQAAQGNTPLPITIREKFQAALRGKWYVESGIFGASLEELKAKKNYIIQNFQDTAITLKFSEINQANSFFNSHLKTNPTSIYWRKKTPMDSDTTPNPEQDGCGVIWLAPVVPFDGQQIDKCLQLITDTISSHSFEPNIGIQCINPRSVYITIAIIYDREIDGEDELAMICYQQLSNKLTDYGYFPYRLGIQAMNSLPSFIDDSGLFFKIMKQALDPNDILSPNRYDFRREWNE